MMVWHGGLSGSAPIKVAEKDHLSSLLSDANFLFPDMISLSETVFSNINLIISAILLLILPIGLYLIGTRNQGKIISVCATEIEQEPTKIDGAAKLDHSKIFAYFLSCIILGYCFYKAFILPDIPSLAVIDPNFINLALLGLGILLHSSFYSFTKAVNSAISGAAGILIQFPLYFGIMGIMSH